MDLSGPLLFEVSSEVCNKVGGIYTVISTKAPVTVEEYGGRVCYLGPYIERKAASEFEVRPASDLLISVMKVLREKHGLETHFGRWLIPGNPFVLLFSLNTVKDKLNGLKHELWEKYQLPSPDHDQEMNEMILFGFVVALFLQEFVNQKEHFRPPSNQKSGSLAGFQGVEGEREVIVHFHEWLAGFGLLFAHKWGIRVATIFTTHATLLGRWICASGSTTFYRDLNSLEPDREAGERGIYHRHLTEKLSAQLSTIFTTVSDITATEAEKILGRKVDQITPNGLGVVRPVAIHEFQNRHAEYKKVIHEFVRGHFHGALDWDLEDDTLYLFTAGRYEYYNKGVDLFLDALANLNNRLKKINSSIRVVAFIVMPAENYGYNSESLKGQSLVGHLRETTNAIAGSIRERIYNSLVLGELPNIETLITADEMVTLKRHLLSMKRDTLPPITTHSIQSDSNDTILNHIRSLALFNKVEDRVKIVFHPEFLSSYQSIIPLEYDQFVRGCHLGCFCSYYEPWGYTPAECTLRGVPSISSNLAGFANYMERVLPRPDHHGIFIVDRNGPREETVNTIAEHMFNFCKMSRRERIEMRNRCERVSDYLSWESLSTQYKMARTLALNKFYGTNYNKK